MSCCSRSVVMRARVCVNSERQVAALVELDPGGSSHPVHIDATGLGPIFATRSLVWMFNVEQGWKLV